MECSFAKKDDETTVPVVSNAEGAECYALEQIFARCLRNKRQQPATIWQLFSKGTVIPAKAGI